MGTKVKDLTIETAPALTDYAINERVGGPAVQPKRALWSKVLSLTIQSVTTAQRLALTPTTPLIVEDTTLDNYFRWSTTTSSWIPF